MATRRHGRRARRDDRGAARAGAGAVRRRAAGRVPPRRWRASSSRERIGDAGLLASDLPDALPMGRKRLAQIAERQRSGRRLGFGARDGRAGTGRRRRRRPRPGPGAGADATVRRGRDAERATRDAGDPRVAAARAGRGAPAARRPATAARATRVAGARPRRAARATSPRSAEAAGPGVRVEPVVKADAYGHGAVPVALRARGRRRRRPLGRDPRRGAGAPRRRDRAPDPRPVPRAGGARRGRGLARDIAVTVGTGELADATWPPRPGRRGPARPARRPRGGRDGPRAAAACCPDGRGRRSSSAVAAAPGVPARRRVDPPRGPDDAADAAGQDARFARRRSRRCRGRHRRGSDAARGPRATLAGSGGILGGDRRRAGTRSAPASPRTGSSRGRRACPGATDGGETGLRPVLALYARPVRVVGAAGRPRRQLRRRRSSPTGPSRIATLPAGLWGRLAPRAVGPGRSALVRGVRVPLVGRVAMDAVMADVTDVPGDARHRGRRVRAHRRRRATSGSPLTSSPRLGGTISHEVVTGMSRRLARVYHAAGSAVAIRTLAGGRSEWRASSSGTATSATSRSTPS